MANLSNLSILFLISCLIGLVITNDAKQADRLVKLIKSRSGQQDDIWGDDEWEATASEVFSPAFMASGEGRRMEEDKISALPGQADGVDFDQYSGFVTVDSRSGRALFYYFVESPNDPSTKPLVLWLNGGPGCSSLGYGAFEELGPFRVNSDGKTLSMNNYAWNKVANVIFLETPAGVGFSYSNTSSDYDLNGDKRTAKDSYTFLIQWMERFPHYKARDFFITGESYAGHYIPQLASVILQNNKLTQRTFINLRGVAIGNAYIDDNANRMGEYEFMWSHALISDETFALIRKSCNFSISSSSSSPPWRRSEEEEKEVSYDCQSAMDEADEEVGSIDIYNIYAPRCGATSHSTYSTWSGGIDMEDFDPCSDNYVNSYLNNPEVQEALHVTSLPYSWQSCKSMPWNDQPATVHPVIKKIIASGVNVWLYSGDVDSVVPITSTRYSLRALNLPVEKSWSPWNSNKEVGGYVESYKGLTLVTIRGAGHAVPSYQPERALTMITSFLKEELPPPS